MFVDIVCFFTEWEKRRRQSAAGSGGGQCLSNKAMVMEIAMAMAIPSAIAMAIAINLKAITKKAPLYPPEGPPNSISGARPCLGLGAALDPTYVAK